MEEYIRNPERKGGQILDGIKVDPHRTAWYFRVILKKVVRAVSAQGFKMLRGYFVVVQKEQTGPVHYI
jgi:hypothetical protein